jgi:GGDEF domain-containing protein
MLPPCLGRHPVQSPPLGRNHPPVEVDALSKRASSLHRCSAHRRTTWSAPDLSDWKRERISEQLAIALTDAGGPSFTVSFGLACSQPDGLLPEAIAVADGALREAKSLGRNCIVVADRREMPAA